MKLVRLENPEVLKAWGELSSAARSRMVQEKMGMVEERLWLEEFSQAERNRSPESRLGASGGKLGVEDVALAEAFWSKGRSLEESAQRYERAAGRVQEDRAREWGERER